MPGATPAGETRVRDRRAGAALRGVEMLVVQMVGRGEVARHIAVRRCQFAAFAKAGGDAAQDEYRQGRNAGAVAENFKQMTTEAIDINPRLQAACFLSMLSRRRAAPRRMLSIRHRA